MPTDDIKPGSIVIDTMTMTRLVVQPEDFVRFFGTNDITSLSPESFKEQVTRLSSSPVSDDMKLNHSFIIEDAHLVKELGAQDFIFDHLLR